MGTEECFPLANCFRNCACMCIRVSCTCVCVFVLCVCLHLQVYVRMAALFSILRGGPHHKKHEAARDA